MDSDSDSDSEQETKRSCKGTSLSGYEKSFQLSLDAVIKNARNAANVSVKANYLGSIYKFKSATILLPLPFQVPINYRWYMKLLIFGRYIYAYFR